MPRLQPTGVEEARVSPSALRHIACGCFSTGFSRIRHGISLQRCMPAPRTNRLPPNALSFVLFAKQAPGDQCAPDLLAAPALPQVLHVLQANGQLRPNGRTCFLVPSEAPAGGVARRQAQLDEHSRLRTPYSSGAECHTGSPALASYCGAFGRRNTGSVGESGVRQGPRCYGRSYSRRTNGGSPGRSRADGSAYDLARR